MYSITRHIGIDCGHRVPFHDSKCRHLHGHRYKIEATVAACQTIRYDTESSSAGMVVDFGHIKDAMMRCIHDPFDHKLLLWENDPLFDEDLPEMLWESIVTVPVIPTAEELAKFWFRRLDDELRAMKSMTADGSRLVALKVWETPNSFAIYDLSYGT